MHAVNSLVTVVVKRSPCSQTDREITADEDRRTYFRVRAASHKTKTERPEAALALPRAHAQGRGKATGLSVCTVVHVIVVGTKIARSRFRDVHVGV